MDKELKMKQMELMIKMKEKSDSEEVSTLEPLMIVSTPKPPVNYRNTSERERERVCACV